MRDSQFNNRFVVSERTERLDNTKNGDNKKYGEQSKKAIRKNQLVEREKIRAEKAHHLSAICFLLNTDTRDCVSLFGLLSSETWLLSLGFRYQFCFPAHYSILVSIYLHFQFIFLLQI